MAHIEFIDQTLRDGQQSLWGMRMQAGMALPVTPLIDKTGFRVVDLAGSSLFEVLIKYCREDPWAGLDLMIKSMPNSRLRGGMRSNACVTFAVTPDALMDLWMRRLCAHGIRSVWIYDALYNWDKIARLSKVAKETGTEVAGTIYYGLAPVYTDEYFGQVAAKMSAIPDVDTLFIYDTCGCLRPERVGGVVAAVKANSRGKPIEIISHNITGLAPQVYLEAIKHGVNIIHTASRPLANGTSIPSTEIMLRNIELLGHTSNLDKSLMPQIASHFERIAKTYGFTIGTPNEYDLFAFEHQVPGGMTGTLNNQLIQHGMGDRLDDVLRETAVVRKELGYPGMITPFSQLVGTLAVLNIVTGKRYSVIPEEVIKYAVGHYGTPVSPIEPDIMDRIAAAPQYKEILAHPPENPTLEELRKRNGGVDDDELLLRALVPPHDIQAMRDAGPVRLDFPTLSSPELDFARQLMDISSSKHLQIKSAEMSIELSR